MKLEGNRNKREGNNFGNEKLLKKEGKRMKDGRDKIG